MSGRLKTRVSDILGVEYPIVMGTMAQQSTAEYVAAAANAGIFACLTSVMFGTGDALREEIRKTRSLTDRAFGVNVNLFPMVSPVDPVECTETVIDEGVRVIETSGRSPKDIAGRIKDAGIVLMHKCVGARHAVTAERLGADIVEIVGFEAAGHPGKDPIGSLVLIPRAVDAVSVPIVAAGGIGDARAIVAAFALGAEGVCIGTAFMATQECPIHPKLKERLVKAGETDSMMTLRTMGDPMRVLRTPLTEEIQRMEEQGATMEDIMEVIGGGKGRHAAAIGEADWTMISAGQVVGQVRDIPTVKELVDRLVREVEEVRGSLNARLGSA